MNKHLDSSKISDAGMANLVRVWLVDDDQNYCDLQRELLNGEPDIRCDRHFFSAESLLQALATESPPNVVLLDVQMPGMSGIEAIPIIHRAVPQIKVLIMTTFFDAPRRRQALANGAANFLTKSGAVKELVAAIHLACRRMPNPSDEENSAVNLMASRVG
jgi:two-component system response regulator DesR